MKSENLTEENFNLKTENEELKNNYLRAQTSIRDLLVAHRPHFMGNWVEQTVEECGLKFDVLGMIRLPNEPGCTFPKEEEIYYFEWTVDGGHVSFGTHETEAEFMARKKKYERKGSSLKLIKKDGPKVKLR